MKKIIITAALAAALVAPAGASAQAPTPADSKNAAKICKAAKRDNPAKFAADFGMKKNAYGRCVSRTAKQLAAERKAEREAERKAAKKKAAPTA